MNSNINLCVCLGYESLVIPLNLINEGKEVIVYSNRVDILKFCRFQNIPIIRAPSIKLRDAARFPEKIKKEVLNSLKGINLESSVVHVCHNMFGISSIVMFFLAKKSNIFFHRIEVNLEDSFSVNFFAGVSIKNKFKNLIFHWIFYRYMIYHHYNIKITYRFYLEQLIPMVEEAWISSNINVLNYEDRQFFFKSVYSKYSVDLPDCRNLFLFTDINELSKYVEKQSLLDMHDFILDSDVTIKGHPNRNFKYDYSNQYPSFMPAQLLVPKVLNSVIALDSTVLTYASLEKNIKAISFLDLVQWKDKSKKIFFKNLITEGGNEILFPQSLDELKHLMQ